MELIKITSCLCCDSQVKEILNWGEMILANNYNNPNKYPIQLNLCDNCHHLQLNEAVPPMILFKDYPYFSGTSETSLKYFKEFAENTLRYFPGAKNVLDIASNDGSQLDAFKSLGLETYGIDPSENLKPVAEAKGHSIICDTIEGTCLDKPFDILTAQNVLAHTSTPLLFLQRCYEMMHDDSYLFIATSQANMVLGKEFDTIYHEHISYFNTTSMKALVQRANLHLVDVFTNPIHGTSYIFVIRKTSLKDPVKERETLEVKNGLQAPSTYTNWVKLSREKALKTKELIDSYRAKGYKIIGCGAAAKGITFLNVTKTKIDALVDTTQAKWYNKVCDTTIYPFEWIKGLDSGKVLFVILAWNFETEIRANILKYRENEMDVFITTNQ